MPAVLALSWPSRADSLSLGVDSLSLSFSPLLVRPSSAASSGESVFDWRWLLLPGRACNDLIRLWRRARRSATGPLVVLWNPFDPGMLLGAGVFPPFHDMYAGLAPAHVHAIL